MHICNVTLRRDDNDVCLRLLLSFFQSSSIQLSIFVLITHAHWNVTVNEFETLSTPTFSLHHFVLLFIVCLCLILTTRSHPFHSASDSHNLTAHNRCDELLSYIVYCCFDFGFNVLIFELLEKFICTCYGHYLSVCRYTSWQSVDFDLHERYICVLYECSILKYSILFGSNLSSASMANDFLFFVLSAFFNMFADLRNVSLFIVVCELQERMCDRLGWSLDLNLIR